jgi:hypothetical protein
LVVTKAVFTVLAKKKWNSVVTFTLKDIFMTRVPVRVASTYFWHFLLTLNLFFYPEEASASSEILVTTNQTTGCCIPEDCYLTAYFLLQGRWWVYNLIALPESSPCVIGI